MAYTNSPLVSYTKLSPNCTKPRNHAIDTITPHCVVGQLSAKATLNLAHFVEYSDNGASCNYAIGTNGDIGLGVEEANRSWCTSNRDNDHRAITIECASDTKHPYAMNSAVYASLVNLCVDICKRNGKKKLLWLGDKTKTLAYKPKSDEMVLSAHRWFANKSCPGDWLYSRFGNLAEEVTEKLGATVSKPEAPAEKPTTTKTLYRVRKSWADSKSQLGAYAVLNNAKKQVDLNPGYYVFDEGGNVVYPTATTTKPVPAPTPVANADKVIWDGLKSKGLNDFAIAGIMGNLYAESGLKSTNLQNTYEKSLGYTDDSYTAAVDNGTYTNFVKDSAGYGLAQWTYWSRKQNLLEYAKSVGKSIGDLGMQVEFLWKELQGFKNVMSVLKSAKSIREASDIVLTEFERPANMSDAVKEKREAFGKKYYDKYASADNKVETPTEPTKPVTTPVKEKKATDPAQSFKKEAAGKYKVTARSGLYLRHGAGTNKPAMCVMPYGTVVQNFGYYTYTNGVSWMYVVATVKGIKYTGFCSKEYLIKV